MHFLFAAFFVFLSSHCDDSSHPYLYEERHNLFYIGPTTARYYKQIRFNTSISGFKFNHGVISLMMQRFLSITHP